MTKESFFSLSTLEKLITNRKIDANNDKVQWLHIKEIQYRRTHPKTLFVRYTHDHEEAQKKVDLSKRGKSTTLNEVPLVPLYTEQRAINPLKKKDLLSMLDLTSPVYHSFYKNLPTTKKPLDDDIDGHAETIDFDIEIE